MLKKNEKLLEDKKKKDQQVQSKEAAAKQHAQAAAKQHAQAASRIYSAASTAAAQVNTSTVQTRLRTGVISLLQVNGQFKTKKN
ncbi:MAG: hypothetical protein EZS28_034999 [Streblomastix strix]|uniref:Uncharacterized protein n=1 Tax=Streblomastix strix TaxID=222440 RepID=A0A5J4UGW1_9EUKA|nr:MAG: hypothetical protein EZS28_034999 [Streblomastix strix]